jgi:L-threonylcarbamoyladenylate synthase
MKLCRKSLKASGVSPSSLKLQRAVAILRAGGVIAYPTETVWGFGCDPLNERAVARLLNLKGRSVEKGLILIGASAEQFSDYLDELEPAMKSKFTASTCRPTTWLVPANSRVPSWIKGDFNSVALRVSTHKLVSDLCLAFGSPIVSTSANKSGYPTPPQPWPLRKFLGNGLDYILPGILGEASGPSEIRDLISDKRIR